MPEAFVLMNAELGSEESIINELKKIDLVKHVYQTITWNIRKLNGVKSTLTMIVME
jgi:hypothetical protein